MINVLVLHALLPPGPCPEGLSRLLAGLPYAKRLELEGRGPEDRCASLAGIALALRGIATMRLGPVQAGELRFPGGGKPFLPGGPSFSVSHGGQRVGVALCADCEVGFDLEQLGVLAGDLGASSSRLARWTATEAVLKAAGRGLRAAQDVELEETLRTGRVDGMSFHLLAVEISNDFVANLATEQAASLVRVEEVEASVLAP